MSKTQAIAIVAASSAAAAKFVFDKTPKQALLWAVIGGSLIALALSIRTSPTVNTTQP